MKAKIADLLFRCREVELPDSCEHCGHDFAGEGGLVVCAFDYAFFTCNHGCEPTDEEEGEHFDGEKLPLGFFCANCSEPVVVGKEKVLESHDMVQVVEDTVWSQAVGRILEEGCAHDPS